MTEAAQVTDWPTRLLLVAMMIALIAIVLWAIGRKWKRIRTEAKPDMLITAAPLALTEVEPIKALFLGTSPAEQWMRKVNFHGLGVRSRCTISWLPQGVWFERVGEPNFFIDKSQLVDCAVGSGIAGTVRAKDSVIIFRWQLADLILDTGVRADTIEGHARLVALVESGEFMSGEINSAEAKGSEQSS
jgi:hypothetical protein